MSILIVAVAFVAGAGAAFGGLPYFDVPNIHLFGSLDIQPFGMLVATGVLVGAELCRRYSIRFGIDDDDLRKLTGWVVVSGFIGAHVFDVLAYQREELSDNPLLIVELWKGISSYGGFIGGSAGFAIFVWMRRMRPGLMADVIMTGLLPGFTIGRIGCSIVHDHIGRTTDFFLGFDYPKAALWARFCPHDAGGHPIPCDPPEFGTLSTITRAHNLGFYELLYLIPVCAIILGLAFSKKRTPAGMLAVLTGVLYAPVRFFFEYLRLNSSDPRYAGLTFAQWMSLVAFAVATYTLVKLIKSGKPAPLAADLGDRMGGYREDVAAPKRKTVAASDDDSDDDAESDDAADDEKKPAAAPKKKPPQQRKSGGKKRR
ncbi:MAG TPA: prolipoprotein diacylglyceryl transferase family protein [Kofleriaceae bacterium]|nr:prolipoprotein diacylglyceryl transferase family protein [Kofleriaceae bacterium]